MSGVAPNAVTSPDRVACLWVAVSGPANPHYPASGWIEASGENYSYDQANPGTH